MVILVPFFGDLEKFRPLLDRWIQNYRASGCAIPWFALGDGAETYALPSMRVEIDGYKSLIRPGRPFDVKGALVCAALLKLREPVLVLDADAFLARDPTATLAPFLKSSIAMPLDHGGIVYQRKPTLDAPFAGVKKLCAGVQFFGWDTGHGLRSRLVAGYRRAFEEIVACERLPWEPQLPHLVEQYAWSVCAHRRGGKILPGSMNWAPAHLGPNEFAVVNHHFGGSKWALDVTPALDPGA